MKKASEIKLIIKQLFSKKTKCKVCRGKYNIAFDSCKWCNSRKDEITIGKWHGLLLTDELPGCKIILSPRRIIAKRSEWGSSGTALHGIVVDYFSKKPLVNISIEEISEMSIFSKNIVVFKKTVFEPKPNRVQIVMEDGSEVVFKFVNNEIAIDLYESISKIQSEIVK